MSVSVLVLVGFLTLVVMGYSFNLREIGGTGEVVERSGLVQVSSVPSGAAIYIDGETTLLLNTNASRTMLAGEHEIALRREGFDEWGKRIKVVEGLMYRLNYPRLFRLEREAEEVLEFRVVEEVAKPNILVMDGAVETTGVKVVGVSPNRETMVVLMDGGLYVLNLNDAKPELRLLELTGAGGEPVAINTVAGAKWSGNSERMLALVNGEWAVVNVRDAKATVWLAGVLGLKSETLKKVSFATETGDRLLVLNNKKELLEVSARGEEVGEPLLTGVEAFDNDGVRVVYTTKAEVIEKGLEDVTGGIEGEEGGGIGRKAWQVRAYRVGEEESHLMMETENEAIVSTMAYFQEVYVRVVEDGKLKILKKAGWPVAGEGVEKVFEKELEFEVESLEKRGKGMVLELVGKGGERSVFDIEAASETVVEKRDGETGWVDEFLRYTIDDDGKLTVRDYDGLNERELVTEGVLKGRAVTISGNNRWLYYFVKMEGGEKLVRERII